MKRILLLISSLFIFCSCTASKTLDLSGFFAPGKEFSLTLTEKENTARADGKIEENGTVVIQYQNAPVPLKIILSEEKNEMAAEDFSVPFSERTPILSALARCFRFLSSAHLTGKAEKDGNGKKIRVFPFAFEEIAGNVTADENSIPLSIFIRRGETEILARFS